MAQRTRSYGDTAGKARLRLTPVAPIPGPFRGDPVVWAAWLYHVDQMTQSQIADLMGVSRATVANYLQAAREQSIVTVTIRSDVMAGVNLSSELRDRFGLQDVLVIPDDRGAREPQQRIGEAGALYLLQILRPHDVLGVAWGRAVTALARALPKRKLPDLAVAQIMGSRNDSDGFSAETCTATIAERLGARCIHLHAPAVVSTPQIRDMLLAEPAIREPISLIRSCTKLLFGICTVKANSLIYGSGLVTVDQSREYIAKGAVGVINGRFFDISGNRVDGPLDDVTIGLTLEDIDGIGQRIAVAGGPDKTECILGALRGGYVTTLVTDEPTARAVLRRA
ncbi:MAG TPA: sugar-binding transcriptional regulator [Alphaproteobacteria bacterium]|nr:sugar-binding transcriptional regulator [Alphaproteobacteria bacterium]